MNLLIDGRDSVDEGQMSSKPRVMAVFWVLMSCATCAMRKEVEVGSYSFFPFDVRYEADETTYTLEVDSVGVVIHWKDGRMLYGKCRPTTFRAFLALVDSTEFAESLRLMEQEDVQFGPRTQHLITLWGRGKSYGAVEPRAPRHPAVVVSLDQPSELPAEIGDLIEILDEMGRESFGEEFEPIGRPRAKGRDSTVGRPPGAP